MIHYIIVVIEKISIDIFMIYLAGDTHGWKAILYVIKYFDVHNVAYKNLGVKNSQEDIALETMLPIVAENVRRDPAGFAVVSCGTGVGVEVGINKFSGIRAALVTNPQLAAWAVEKDKCNVMCLVGWQATEENIHKMLDAWLSSVYDGSQKRLAMIDTFDTWH